jgi:hypothetical protein
MNPCKTKLNILAWNCEAVNTCTYYLNLCKYDLILLSETLLKPSSSVYIPNYHILHRMDYIPIKNQKAPMRGILVLLHKDSQFKPKIITHNMNQSYVLLKINNLYICFMYIAPRTTREDIIGNTLKILKITNGQPLIITGDLNLDPKKTWSRVSFKEMRNVLQQNDVIHQQKNMTYTFHNHNGHSDVDHVFSSSSIKIGPIDYDKDLSNSHHLALSFQAEIENTRLTKNSNRKNFRMPWRLHHLKSMDKETKTSLVLESSLELDIKIKFHLNQYYNVINNSDHQMQIDGITNSITKSITETAEKYIGRSNGKWRAPNFMNSILLAMKLNIKMLRKDFNLKHNYNDSENNSLKRLSDAIKNYKKEIGIRNRELTSQYFKKISKLRNTELMKLTRKKKSSESYYTNNNAPTADLFADHFKNIYKSNSSNNNITMQQHQMPNNKKQKHTINDNIMPTPTHITSELIDECISVMPNSKSCGPDNIPGEFIKLWKTTLLPYLVKLFNLCIETNLAPTEWKKGLLVPIIKPTKNPTAVDSYRPVTLLNHLRKLYERCLYKNIYPMIAESIPKSQFGFMQNKNTIDAVMYLDMIQKQHRNKQPCIAFLDVKSAYDSVERKLLWKKLLEILNNNYTRSIISLFDHNNIRVINNNTESKVVQLERGLTQGSVLAPILYNIFISDINLYLKNDNNIKIKLNNGEYEAHIIQFADDLAILANNETKLNKMLKKCLDHSIDNQYIYNTTKSCTMNCKKTVLLDGKPLKDVEKFTYLGINMMKRGIDNKSNYERLLTAADEQYKKVQRWGFAYTLPIHKKRALMECCIRPCFEYGLALLNQSITHTNRLDMKLHNALSYILNFGKHMNSYALRTCMGMKGTNQRRMDLQNMLSQNLHLKASTYTMYQQHPILVKFNENLILDNGSQTNKETYMKNNRIPIVKRLAFLVMNNGHRYEFNSAQEWTKKGVTTIPQPYLGKIGTELAAIMNSNSRILHCYTFNRYPGQPIRCKKCREIMHNYVSHLNKCSKTKKERLAYYQKLGRLKQHDWKDLNHETRQKILTLLVELKMELHSNL